MEDMDVAKHPARQTERLAVRQVGASRSVGRQAGREAGRQGGRQI